MCYDHSSIEKHKGKVSINRLIKHQICFNLSSSLTLQTSLVESPFCGSRISHEAFPLDGKTRFLFIWWKFDFSFWKKPRVATYFCFIFLKGKQNKKENPKCDFLFGKDSLWQTKVGFGGQVTHWEGMVVSRSTPLSPTIRSLLNKVKQVWQLIRKSMDTNEMIK